VNSSVNKLYGMKNVPIRVPYKNTKGGWGGGDEGRDSFFFSERGAIVRLDQNGEEITGGWMYAGHETLSSLTHAMAPRSLSAQHPMLLSISSGNVSGPTALFWACSISSIL
jgi:hypothetical protein